MGTTISYHGTITHGLLKRYYKVYCVILYIVLLIYTVMPEYALIKRTLTDLCSNALYNGFFLNFKSLNNSLRKTNEKKRSVSWIANLIKGG